MSAIIKTIEDMLHNKIYPKTKVEAVYDDDNNRLDSLLSAKEDASDDFVLKGTSESVPSISDPVLHQSDISTTQSTATNTVPSSSLVKTMNDSIAQLNSDLASKANSDNVPSLNKATANIINNMTISYVGSAATTGNDTLQFGYAHGTDNYFLKIGTNGIQFVKNGNTVWTK